MGGVCVCWGLSFPWAAAACLLPLLPSKSTPPGLKPTGPPLNPQPQLWVLHFILGLFQKQNLHCLRNPAPRIRAAERAGCFMKENF